MHLRYRGVNAAFRGLVEGIHTGKIPTHVCASRNGEVGMVEEPVIVTYEKPLERVLFNPARDANPFFHLYEALWMLAGRNDVAPLVYYAKKIKEYSDDGETLNGAYGYRWRNATAYLGNDDDMRVDQLNVIIDHLKHNPSSRRAVLQMWNVEDDLLKTDSSKDVCCNTCVYFAVEQGMCLHCNGKSVINQWPEPCPKCGGKPHDQPRRLNMTVCNRSNDLVWGMLGANVVHFSFLQEYLAAHLGLEVGVYNQMTNNLHYYSSNWQPEKWLAEPVHDYYGYGIVHKSGHKVDWSKDKPISCLYSLVKDPAVFDRELPRFVERFSGKLPAEDLAVDWEEPFFAEVAQPMLIACACHKIKDDHSAFQGIDMIEADDWKRAAYEWLNRRVNR